MTIEEIVQNVRGRTIEETAVLQMKALFRSLFGKEKADETEKAIDLKLQQEIEKAKKAGKNLSPQEKEEKIFSLYSDQIYSNLSEGKKYVSPEQKDLEFANFKQGLKDLSKESHELFSKAEGNFNGVKMAHYLKNNPNALSETFNRIVTVQEKFNGLVQEGQKLQSFEQKAEKSKTIDDLEKENQLKALKIRSRNSNYVEKDYMGMLQNRGYIDFGYQKEIYNVSTGIAYDNLTRAALNNYVRHYKVFDGRFATEKQIENMGLKIKPGSKPIDITMVERIDQKTHKKFSQESVKNLSGDQKKDYMAKNTILKEQVFTLYNGSDIEGLDEFKIASKEKKSEFALKNNLQSFLEKNGLSKDELEKCSTTQLIQKTILTDKQNEGLSPVELKLRCEIFSQKLQARYEIAQKSHFISPNDIGDLEKAFKETKFCTSKAFDSVKRRENEISSFLKEKYKGKEVDRVLENKSFQEKSIAAKQQAKAISKPEKTFLKPKTNGLQMGD